MFQKIYQLVCVSRFYDNDSYNYNCKFRTFEVYEYCQQPSIVCFKVYLHRLDSKGLSVMTRGLQWAPPYP